MNGWQPAVGGRQLAVRRSPWEVAGPVCPTDRPRLSADCPPNARWYAALTAAFAAFVLYGSWMPFDFTPKPLATAVHQFGVTLTHREWVRPSSRSDFAANCLLGVPVGFGLLAAARSDRRGAGRTALAAVALWPLCLGLALLAEFGQLFVPGRSCAGSDVYAQGLGAAAGMAGWMLVGQRLTDQARRVLADPLARRTAARLLAGYVLLIAAAQWLPLDLTASPREVYRKLRDHVEFVPFGEFRAATDREQYKLAGDLAQLAAVFLPAGLLAARLGVRPWDRAVGLPWALAGGAAVAAVTEFGQLFVQSRTPSMTAVAIGGLAVAVGWAVGRRFAGGVSLAGATAAAAAWLAVLAVSAWQPFDFGGWPGTHPAVAVPLSDAQRQGYFLALQVLLARALSFVPFGVLVAAVGPVGWGWRRVVVGAAVGAAVSAVLEAGQFLLPTRTPSATDVVLGAVGAGAAVVPTRWLRGGQA